MDLSEARITFIQEAQELLASMEDALLAMENHGDHGEDVNAMFRAVHTIKGSAGLFGLDGIVAFAHTVESVMDRVRDGAVSLEGSSLVGLLFRCHDHLARLIGEIGPEGQGPDQEALDAGEELLAQLRPYLQADRKAGLATAETAAPEAAAEAGHWHLSIRFGQGVLRDGMDPLSFVRYLGTLGRIVHVTPLLDTLPEGDDFDPETCYLGLELDLDTQADRATLEGVFEFVRDQCQLQLIPPHSAVEEYIRLIQGLPEGPGRLGEILVAGGCITPQDLEDALASQQTEGARIDPRLLGTILVQDQGIPPPVVAEALDKQSRSKDKLGQELRVVKVQADRLDRLVDLVGELVIASATTKVLAGHAGAGPLLEACASMDALVADIRDSALGLRMVQIGETFSRFRRVVRDLCQDSGKVIELEIHGAETELDKSIVEKLNDPLMHIVRNAIDHGIERPEVRLARGKPAAGTLRLEASHESGSMLIQVTDDGAGLNRGRILAKARERGLVGEGEEIGDDEILDLIFQPGFSTAEAITNLSGRGVGMDVVRRNIDELRGSIEVATEEGDGTSFRIRLPLTLAIIEGFRVEVDQASYVIPQDMVMECLDLAPVLESERAHLLNLRGEAMPFLRLRDVFHLPSSPSGRERVVVVQFGGTRAGLVVDRLLGEFQTVIKPLGTLFRKARGIGGSTILGSGEVALILDVPQLVQMATRRTGQSSLQV